MLAELEVLSNDLFDAPLEVRLQHFAHKLLGVTFGSWQDGSDLETEDDFNYNLEQLDCVTYVEVVLALAKNVPGSNFVDLLRKIHYKNGVPNYLSRNHFMSLDWIPNNNFVVRDVTSNVALELQTATTIIDKLNWLKKTRSEFAIPENLLASLQPQEVSSPYIDTTHFLDNQSYYFDKFPEAGISCIVRPDWNMRDKIGTNLNISHLGFVFRDHVTRTLRFYHASGFVADEVATAEVPRKVVNTDFCEYLARFIDSPTIRGCNILSVTPGYYAGQ